MSKASKASLWKKGLGVFAAAALASAVMAAPAFATDSVSVQGYTTNTGTGTSVDGDTQMYIQQAPAGAISVTAPTKLYFYLTNETPTTIGALTGVEWGQFITPSKSVVTLTNNGTNSAKVTGWTVANTAGQFTSSTSQVCNYTKNMTKANYDASTATWSGTNTSADYANVSGGSVNLGEYYLLATPNGAPTSFDLAVDNATPAAINWTMLPGGAAGDTIELDLQGEMKGFDTGTGLDGAVANWFQTGDRPLQTVTWTFANV